jgi:hypothetical protein
MKIHSAGIELYYAYGRTDGQSERQTSMTKLTVAFRNVSNVPKNLYPCYRFCSCLESQVSECGCTDQTGIVGSNPLTPELNPSAQRCLMRFVTGDFAS